MRAHRAMREGCSLFRHARCVGVLVLVLCARSAHAQDLLVSSRFSDNVLRYDSTTGAFRGVFAAGGGMDNPNGIAFGPDGNLYVGLGDVGRVLRFDGQSGAYIDDFIEIGAGGLVGARAIAFSPDGDLFVDSGGSDQVLRYHGQTGEFLGVAAQGFDGPVGLTFAPDGNMIVGAALSNTVFEYDPSGQLVRTYSEAGFSNTTGVLIGDDGLLYVAMSVSDAVLRFDRSTGLLHDIFVPGGGDLDIPIGMTFLPGGDLLVGSFGNDAAIRYDGATGAQIGFFIEPGSGGLNGTHNFAFMPVPAPHAITPLLLTLALSRIRRSTAPDRSMA